MESAGEFEALFNLSPSLLCVAEPDGYFKRVNPAFLRLLGYTEEELLANPFISLIHPDDIEATLSEMKSLQRGVTTINFENRYRHRDGHYLVLSWSASTDAETGRIYAVAHDMTEARKSFRREKKAAVDLRISEEKYRSIVEGSDDLINVLGPDGRFKFVNHVSEQIYGTPPEECVGLSYAEFVHKDDLDDTTAAVEAWVSEQRATARYENRQVSRDGSVRDVSWNIALHYDEQGGVETIIAIGRDVTDQKQMERSLEQALDDVRRASEAKSQFLAAISHELRTPLNAIIGFSEILAGQYFGPPGAGRYREYAADIHKSGEHLLELVNDLLDISKIEAGSVSLNKEPIDLTALIANCVRTVETRANEKNINLTNGAGEFPNTLEADRRATTQILLNLLSNAVKFTQEGGDVSVSIEAANEALCIAVADNGPGIPPETQSEIMKPFVTGSRNPHISDQGWGLGLSIAKSLIELQGGELAIESVMGQGTKVTMQLPLVPTQQATGV